MRAHTLLRHSIVALIVAALIATVYSLSVAQDVPAKNTWQAVKPELLPADLVGKGINIKVGHSYKFVNYDAAEQAMLGVQYLYKPREANAKRVLTVYDLSKFLLKDWVTIDQATPPDENPPLAAFLVPVGDDVYIGTPLKWNKQLGAAMRAAVSTENKHPKMMASTTMRIFADDVLTRAAHKQAMPVLQGKVSGPTGVEMLSSFKRAGIRYDAVPMGWTPDELRLMKAGDPAPMVAKQPKNPVYIAFDREFADLSIEPLGRIISVSGVGGERLGYQHPAWPLEKSK